MRVLGVDKGAIEVLIAINVLVFIVTLVNPEYVLRNLALIPAIVLWKPWSIITSMFVHGGFGHIIFNMLVLFFFGLYLERLVGEKEFLKIYFIGGIVANMVYIFTSLFLGLPDPSTPVVGASGALFAVMGTLVVLRPNMQVIVFPIMFPIPLWMAVFGSMFLLSFVPNVAFQAHLGGLVTGLILGHRIKKQLPEQLDYHGRYGFRFY